MNDLRKNLDYYIPNPRCELIYKNDYELLLSIMLSSQTTDKMVNKVTKNLFKYDLESIAKLDEKDIETIIKPLGNYHKKAKYVKEISNILLTKYNKKVPTLENELILFPGVGRKTINVFLSEMYDIPTIAVDTHVERVSKRLGLALDSDDVITIENKLKKIFKKEEYNKINHQLLLFGRYFCKAKNPLCDDCKMNCKFKKTR